MKHLVDLVFILVGACCLMFAGSVMAEPDKGPGSAFFWAGAGALGIWGGTRDAR